MASFDEHRLPEGAWWSPLARSGPLPLEEVADHPRVVLDPRLVLPDPSPRVDDGDGGEEG